jgi:transcriptional regulator with XRE-family HTH domain
MGQAVAFAQLKRVLTKLGYRVFPGPGNVIICSHRRAGREILLPGYQDSQVVRPVHLNLVMKTLDAFALCANDEFERLLVVESVNGAEPAGRGTERRQGFGVGAQPVVLHGDRIAWARTHQGISLKELHQRTGLSARYLAKLERENANPTAVQLRRLAEGLKVPVQFLLGEDVALAVQPVHPEEVSASFRVYLEQMPAEQQQLVATKTLEDRFGLVVNFLCEHYPAAYTPAVIALRIAVSLPVLQEIIDHQCALTLDPLLRLSQLSGIPLDFFATGSPSTGRIGGLTATALIKFVTSEAESERPRTGQATECKLPRSEP